MFFSHKSPWETHTRGSRTVHHKLIFQMAFFDIFTGIVCFMSVDTFGNENLCEIQAFILHFSTQAAALIATVIAFNLFLQLRYLWEEEAVAELLRYYLLV